SGISAIFASTSLSPSALSARRPRRAAAFSSWARSLIAARSSSANPLGALPVVLLVGFCVPFASASLPGAFFSDISASFPVAFSRKTPPLSSRLTRDEPYSWGGRDRVAGLLQRLGSAYLVLHSTADPFSPYVSFFSLFPLISNSCLRPPKSD